MAYAAAAIDLRVNGLKDVTALENGVKALTKSLKSVPSLFREPGTSKNLQRIRKETRELEQEVIKIANGTRRLSNTTAGLNQQLGTLQTVAANTTVGTTTYGKALEAAERASRSLARAEVARLNVLNNIYTATTKQPGGASVNVKEILDLGKSIPNSVAGLEFYETQLRDLLRVVNIGSADFFRLSQAIDQVGTKLAAARGVGPLQGPMAPPVQGPALPPGGIRRSGARRAVRGRTRTQLLESLMLGAGFPLLFGGGAGEVAGGLLGSFGPGQGFGGQILGSAIGGIFDDFISSAGELGAALNPATADLDRLVDALGGASTVTGQYIKKLEDLERSEEALAVATAELENLVGKRGVEALRAFGDDSTKLAGLFSQAMAQMQSGVVAFINSTEILRNLIAGLEYNVLLRQALTSPDPGQQALVQEREAAGRGALFGGDPGKFIQINNQLVAQQRQINDEKRKQYETSLELLTVEERQVEITKQTTKLAKELKSSYDEILKSAEDRIQKEQAAVDRGLTLSKARYEAELALNQLEQTRLERAYKYAENQRERLDIAIAMFNTEVETAKLEYQQQLESIAAEERKLEIQLEQYRLAQETILLKADEARLAAELEPDAELRAASFKRIDDTTARYLDKTREIILEVEKQLAVQREIGQVQRQTAKAQLENKILTAQTRLEQKLVSEEIGLSERQAVRLSNALAAAKQEAIFTAQRGQQIVGVIEVGTQKTYIMAQAMSDVAAQAANAAAQIRSAVSAQNALNTAKAGGSSSGLTRAAKGAYMSGGFQAFADGGIVNRPTLGLIGEGGEPEYVVPASKAKGFSMRYLSGARGSAAIPTSGDGGSSSGPVNINIHTGPVMRHNDQNYVSVGDMERALQTFANTMLRNSRTPGARRYAGIG